MPMNRKQLENDCSSAVCEPPPPYAMVPLEEGGWHALLLHGIYMTGDFFQDGAAFYVSIL